MAPLYVSHDYYKKMLELQEKLRKSEEERIRLEERFNMLVRESHSRHDACINRLRMRYIQYLEEQRTRDERNHKLLAALDKVMNKLALISAKKDRLNVLRKQYEAYLLRVYANHQPPGSITGDSGIASQNEDRCPRKIAVTHPDLASAEMRSIPSPRAPLQSNQLRSTYASKFHEQSSVNSTLLNNTSTLPTTSTDTPLDVDYRHRTNVLPTPHVYTSLMDQSEDQLAQLPMIPNIPQYSRTVSDYDRNVPRNLRDISNLTRTMAPVLLHCRSSKDHQTHLDVVPGTNQFFKQDVESMQAAPRVSSTVRLPTTENAARYEDASLNQVIHSYPPRQFNSLPCAQPFQYHDVNVLLNPQSQIGRYDPSDAAVSMGFTPVTTKSSTYPASMGPEMSVHNQVEPLPGYMDYILRSPQKSEDEGSTRSLTSDDVDDLIRRNERLLWRNVEIDKTPRESSIDLDASNVNLDENGKTTAILENELDRYISNIRKLHREHGVPSQDELEHEQNTSGDLLNVTLSEDALELPAEDKVGKERVPKEMDRILELASDLASRTADLRKDAIEQNASDSTAEVANEIRHQAIRRSNVSELEGERDAFADKAGRISARNEIREDVATCPTELDQSHKEAKIAKEDWNNARDLAKSQECDREASNAKKDDTREEMNASSNDRSQINNQRNVAQEEQYDIFTGEESNVEGLFNIAKELAPWDLANVQKGVRELHLDDPDSDRARETQEMARSRISEKIVAASESSRFIEQRGMDGEIKNSDMPQDMLPLLEAEMRKSDVNEEESCEKSEMHIPIVKSECISSEISNKDRHQECKTDEPIGAPQMDERYREQDEGEDDGEERKDTEELLETHPDDQSRSAERDNEYNVEQGYMDPGQVQEYEQDPNAQYHYDQSVPYEGAGNEEYERYADQGYAQEGQEYVEYVDGQYEQYAIEPDGQQYDPNVQYEQDPNQVYDYTYDQQYDPNQGYEGDPNQAYEYAGNFAYAPNQAYDSTYEQEYKEEQRNLEDDIVVDIKSSREEELEVEEASSEGQMDPGSEQKADEVDEIEAQRAVNDQSRKKKDVIKSLLDSDTDTTIERNISNTESDFDFN